MLFNSIEFVIFLPIIFFLYWKVFAGKQHRRNLFLLLASYVFYGFWDPRFLILIIASSITDYFVGRILDKSRNKRKRKLLLLTSLLVNLGILGYFKYSHFFITEFCNVLEQFGWQGNVASLKIILPVGISFYTFQTLSYTIDIYRKKISATHDWLAFFAFVAFFPQLVAGPIERASRLLPQFSEKKKMEYRKMADGFRQILWGLFAKVVVADSVAPFVDSIFKYHDLMSSPVLILGAFLFSIQIYGDFSGYSNIAIGTAKLFGFDLMTNFRMPYFSSNLREFWTRWHISLSTWFRDYVYIPLGGNRRGKTRRVLNVCITFLVSGLWHGANWTFIAWGGLHALGYSFSGRKLKTDAEKNGQEIWHILLTFIFVCFSFVFFRAESIRHAYAYLKGIVIPRAIQTPLLQLIDINDLIFALLMTGLLLLTEWIQKTRAHPLAIADYKPALRHIIYYAVIALVMFAFTAERAFIYFQF